MLKPETRNKLILLYMLDAVDFPLSSSQISSYVLNREYMDYFEMNRNFAVLIDDGLITASPTHNSTQYRITRSGSETLSCLEDKLPGYIKSEIEEYFKEKRIELKNESSILADYYKTGIGYATRCVVKKKGEPEFEILLNVATKETAQAICNNWREKKDEVFEYLMDILVR